MAATPTPPGQSGGPPDGARQPLDDSVVVAMADGLVVFDATGAVTASNPAAEAILGLTWEQLRGLAPMDPLWRAVREDGTVLLAGDLPHARVLSTGAPVRGEVMGIHGPDGAFTWIRVDTAPLRGPAGALAGAVSTFSDITGPERRRRVDHARLRLLALPPGTTLAELLRATIDEAERLTGSRIGFFHFVDADEKTLFLQTWSTNTLERMCTAEGAGQHYPVEKAGVWADALRLRRPIVHNDYPSMPGRKGMPPGHAVVSREAVVPVFRDGRICAMLGVGNKDTDYLDGDVTELVLLADMAWDLAARASAAETLLERKAELRRERERLALAVEAGKVGLWELDLATGRAWRTLEHDLIFGYEALQPSWGTAEALAHVVPEDRPVFERAFEEARRTGRFHYELRIEPAGRPRRWIVADGRMENDEAGTPVRMRGTVVDVTARKEAEDAVRRNERLYRAVAHHYPHGVVGLYGADHRILLLDGMQPVLTPAPGAAIGKRPSEFAPPEIAPVLERIFGEALAGRSARAEIHPRDRVVEISTHPIREDDGRVVLGLVLSEDVTDRRNLEARLATTSRLAAMGTLVAGVAHEINNPLVGQVAGEGLALEEAEELLSICRSSGPLDRPDACRRLEEIAETLRDAQASGLRIARIVKDLALFAHPDGRREKVHLRDVAELALRWLPASVSRTVAIRIEDAGAPPVEVSQGQVEQVIVNLVANAARAIPLERPGHVTIRLGPGEPGKARMEIEDDGVGMTPEVVRRIFDPFFTTRRVGQGTGLGLPVVHSIVAAHGGTISVASQPGEGTTFRVELPEAQNLKE